MAVFVMAVGVLSMVVLYPLGLRESRQGQDDLQQAMLADRVFNQLVAALSHTEVKWSAWKSVPLYAKAQDSNKPELNAYLSSLVPGSISLNPPSETDTDNPQLNHKIYCHRVPGTSGKIMGLQVDFLRKLRLKDETVQSYYAEVMFQGNPEL